jgi:hypothetical protein
LETPDLRFIFKIQPLSPSSSANENGLTGSVTFTTIGLPGQWCAQRHVCNEQVRVRVRVRVRVVRDFFVLVVMMAAVVVVVAVG